MTPYFPYDYLIRAKIGKNTYHFTNEQAGIPVKWGKSARYFGKLEVIYVFANIPYLLVVHHPHKLGGHNCQ